MQRSMRNALKRFALAPLCALAVAAAPAKAAEPPLPARLHLSPCIARPLAAPIIPLCPGYDAVMPAERFRNAIAAGLRLYGYKRLTDEVNDASRFIVIRPEFTGYGLLFRLHADPALSSLSLGRDISPDRMETMAKYVGGRVSAAILTVYTEDWPVVNYFQRLQTTINETLERDYSLHYETESGAGFHARGVFNFNTGKFLGIQATADFERINIVSDIFPDGLELRTRLATIDSLRVDLGYYRSFRDRSQRGVVLMLEYRMDRE